MEEGEQIFVTVLLLISLCLAQLRRRLMKENEKSFLLLFFNSQEGHFQIPKNDPPPLPSLLSPQVTPIFLSLPSFSPHLRKGRRRRVPFSFLLSWGSECGETLNFLGGERASVVSGWTIVIPLHHFMVIF